MDDTQRDLFADNNLLMVVSLLIFPTGMGPRAVAQSISRENIIVSLAYGGNDQATSADYALNSPEDVAVDGSGNVFVVDTTNNVIREISPGQVYLTPSNFTSTATVTGGAPIIAGEVSSACTVGEACGDGGPATSATLNAPAGVAVDSAGNVYIAGGADPRIRVVCMNCAAGTPAYSLLTAEGQLPANGNIYTVAGNGTAAYRGDGGLATSAELKTPSGAAVDSLGNLYIADSANNRIRLVCTSCSSGAANSLLTSEGQSPTNGDIYTVAGDTTETGTLPGGVTFVDNGNGTATLSGAPSAGTTGIFPLALAASNGISPNASQSFTLTVVPPQAPAITSANNITFTVGTAGGFTVIATGAPTPTPIAESGALPGGVTFVDNGNGTAALSGTPVVGASGNFPLTITASNSVNPNATQSFNLTVDQVSIISSANNTTFTAGSAGNFTVTTRAYPIAVSSLVGGALPSGVTLVDNGNGTATLSSSATTPSGNYPFTLAGTPTAAGTFSITFTASNTSGSTQQSFTLTVN